MTARTFLFAVVIVTFAVLAAFTVLMEWADDGLAEVTVGGAE